MNLHTKISVRLCSTLCPTHIFPLDPLKQPCPPSDQPVYETLVLPLLLMMHINTNGFDYKMADCWMFLTTVLFKSLEFGRFDPFIQQGCIKLIKCDSKCCSFELSIYQRLLKKENHSFPKNSKQCLTGVIDCWKFCFDITIINYFLKCIKIEMSWFKL